MARPLWRGAITFGLVSIPVEVHTAVREKKLQFHLLTVKDKSRVKYQRVSEKTGKPVEWDDLVKGYEYQKGRFVVLTPQDFEAAALEKNKRIDILDFVKAEEIDDRYFDKPYYLTPAAGGDRAYSLLRETIRDSGRVGVAKFVLREKQHLAAVEVVEDALVLSTLRFADELVDTAEYNFPKRTGVGQKELKVAKMLVDELASEWNPEQYTDDYRANLMKIIQAKRKGKEVRLEAPEEAPPANVVDLMERLRSSLEGAGGRRRAGAAKSTRKAKTTRRRKETRHAA
jgi:DNA end-binding protein Ku